MDFVDKNYLLKNRSNQSILIRLKLIFFQIINEGLVIMMTIIVRVALIKGIIRLEVVMGLVVVVVAIEVPIMTNVVVVVQVLLLTMVQ